MAMLAATILGLLLTAATCLIHYEILRKTADLMPRLHVAPRATILAVMAGVFIAHFVEIVLYAAALGFMDNAGFGAIEGTIEGSAFDFLYLSLTSYTTLGVGDVVPIGPMRVVTSIEALNGFLLIGWSTAFSFPAMEKLWERDRRRARA